jgi:hypothetical protein
MMVMLVMLACSLGLPTNLKQIEASAMPDLKGLEQTALPDFNTLKTMAPGIEKALTAVPTEALPPGQKPVLPPPQFPVTPDAANLSVTMVGDFAMVNYQTKLSLKDAQTFCRNRLISAGYKEQPALTSTGDVTFSMVFTAPSNDKQVVIQGIAVGGLTNVNIRSEKVQ